MTRRQLFSRLVGASVAAIVGRKVMPISAGGIVASPLRSIGESGPEAIISLSRLPPLVVDEFHVHHGRLPAGLQRSEEFRKVILATRRAHVYSKAGLK